MPLTVTATAAAVVSLAGASFGAQGFAPGVYNGHSNIARGAETDVTATVSKAGEPRARLSWMYWQAPCKTPTGGNTHGLYGQPNALVDNDGIPHTFRVRRDGTFGGGIVVKRRVRDADDFPRRTYYWYEHERISGRFTGGTRVAGHFQATARVRTPPHGRKLGRLLMTCRSRRATWSARKPRA